MKGVGQNPEEVLFKKTYYQFNRGKKTISIAIIFVTRVFKALGKHVYHLWICVYFFVVEHFSELSLWLRDKDIYLKHKY